MVERLPKQMTAREYARIAYELGPSELVAGEVVFHMAGGRQHSIITATIVALLHALAKGRRAVVMTNEAGFITRRRTDTVCREDVAGFSRARLGGKPVRRGFVSIPPNLVVEVLGKGKTWNDVIEKAAEYLRFGCDVVWLVDPAAKKVCVLRDNDEPEVLTARETLSDARVLPGFSCRVGELFGF